MDCPPIQVASVLVALSEKSLSEADLATKDVGIEEGQT